MTIRMTNIILNITEKTTRGGYTEQTTVNTTLKLNDIKRLLSLKNNESKYNYNT